MFRGKFDLYVVKLDIVKTNNLNIVKLFIINNGTFKPILLGSAGGKG